MAAVIEVDEKGRILIPAEIRKKFKSRRFEVTSDDERIELRPLEPMEKLKGKYRKIIKSNWEEMEEKGEEFVSRGRR